MSVFQDFLLQLRDQMLRSQRPAPVDGQRGTVDVPLVPNMDARLEAMRRGAVVGGADVPKEPFKDIPKERERELYDEYADTQLALRDRDKLEARVKGQGGQFVVIPSGPQVTAGQYTRPEDDDTAILYDRVESMRKAYPELEILPPHGDYMDEQVAARGWQPEDFMDGDTPVSHAEAASIIASQLKARRIRQMGQLSPDYIDTLPIY